MKKFIEKATVNTVKKALRMPMALMAVIAIIICVGSVTLFGTVKTFWQYTFYSISMRNAEDCAEAQGYWSEYETENYNSAKDGKKALIESEDAAQWLSDCANTATGRTVRVAVIAITSIGEVLLLWFLVIAVMTMAVKVARTVYARQSSTC